MDTPLQQWAWGPTPAVAGRAERVGAVVGLAALAAIALPAAVLDRTSGERTAGPAPAHEPAAATGSRELLAGGYLGTSYTHPSTVVISNPGRTELTVKDFGWLGRPFKSPIYYGLRGIAWQADARFAAMLDFTHAKAIANPQDVAAISGTREGKPVSQRARIEDYFRHLEFSHGHNMVTLNGLAALGLGAPWLRPYVGLGAGISLPHTEIGFRDESVRTYEYQYAGLVGQAVAGVEIRLPRASVFLEYKLTYAPYSVPLSGVNNGWLLVTDVWRQLAAAWRGERPPGGRLSTTLVSHHAIAGALIRTGAPLAR